MSRRICSSFPRGGLLRRLWQAPHLRRHRWKYPAHKAPPGVFGKRLHSHARKGKSAAYSQSQQNSRYSYEPHDVLRSCFDVIDISAAEKLVEYYPPHISERDIYRSQTDSCNDGNTSSTASITQQRPVCLRTKLLKPFIILLQSTRGGKPWRTSRWYRLSWSLQRTRRV